MFSTSQSTMMNNGGELDGSGTINPATLNPAGAFSAPQGPISRLPQSFYGPTPTTHDYSTDSKPRVPVIDQSPRGVKRSRSPEVYREGQVVNDDISQGTTEEPVRRKRGRPPKNKSGVAPVPPSPNLNSTPQQPQPQQQQQQLQPHQQQQQQPQPQQQQQQQQAPQPQPPQQTHQQQLPPPPPHQIQQADATPQQAAVTATPPKPAQPKPVVKALPTVRDHTTDQLTPEGDEYLPREFDEEGDKKVLPTGHLVNGREYRCRTFHVPNRGDKLFMLATECARVLGYRDSYLLFNKNRSLYKIIATQAEKDDLIAQELLPYSYRSRQIAIVTARSMFRQFGSRVIVGGRRVRDDYWETKAKKQGFTEDDLAGEKRPGAAKQRQQQAEQAQQQQAQQAQQTQQAQAPPQPHHEPAYPHESVIEAPQPQMVQPGLGGPAPGNMAPLPMIHLSQTQHNPEDSNRYKELLAVPRPRQEVTGPPYHDRVQPTPTQAMAEQVQQANDYNKNLVQQRGIRREYNNNYFKPTSPPKPVQTQVGGQQLPNPQPQVVTPAMSHPPPQHNPHPQQHAQLAPPHPPAHMSPQQLSSLQHQQQQQQQQQQHQQQHQQQQQHPNMPQQSPVRIPQNIKPEQLHNQGYMNQQPYFHSPAPQPSHPQHPQQQPHSQPLSQPHPSLMHPQHQGGQPMYSAQQHYLQQPAPTHSWKPAQQQPGWWGHQQ
ncbi:hypothetical protein L211DRAFT_845379 [Terfezia boudieri ATCC MYA-4762]|uniref:Uncharacterized protein n=1 Tax=Terfezia boudieri ATCC MYA-4762 TaxID=1051890 RepID=A0A3N4M6C6_9PEZI|nr:hypothetical protein L211DRAFT_845379 [Terfezia boudieri ATCC MYA-4762]